MKRIAAMLFLLSVIIYGCATSSGPTMVSERQTGVALKSGKQKWLSGSPAHSNLISGWL